MIIITNIMIMYPANCYQKIIQTSICEKNTFCYAIPNSFDIYLHRYKRENNEKKYIKLNNTCYYELKPEFDRWPLTGYERDNYSLDLKFDLKTFQDKPFIRQIVTNYAVTCNLIKHHVIALMSNNMVLMYASPISNKKRNLQKITSSTIPILLSANLKIDQIYSADNYVLF